MKLVRLYAHLRSSNQENLDNFDAVKESEESWSGKKQMSNSCHQKLHIAYSYLYLQSITIVLSYYNLIFIYVVLIASATSSTSLVPKNLKRLIAISRVLRANSNQPTDGPTNGQSGL